MKSMVPNNITLKMNMILIDSTVFSFMSKELLVHLIGSMCHLVTKLLVTILLDTIGAAFFIGSRSNLANRLV